MNNVMISKATGINYYCKCIPIVIIFKKKVTGVHFFSVTINPKVKDKIIFQKGKLGSNY